MISTFSSADGTRYGGDESAYHHRQRTKNSRCSTHLAGFIGRLLSLGLQFVGLRKQRVAIVRALALEPDAILFDEPTSALDPQLVGDVLEAMRELAGSGLTLIVVSHEMAFARALADNVHFVSGGHIVESGSARQIFEEPKTAALQQFMESIRSA